MNEKNQNESKFQMVEKKNQKKKFKINAKSKNKSTKKGMNEKIYGE